MIETDWYRRWFGEEYLLLYAHRDEEEATRQVATVLDRWGAAPPGRLLDVACGMGRHARAFAGRGIPAVGFDLSDPLLRRARAGGGPAAPAWVRGDMRSLPFADGAFDAVASFFTSIGYFEEDDENLQVLREMSRVLAPGGRLVLDTFNPGPTRESLVPDEERLVGANRVLLRRWFDAARRRIEKEIRIFSPGGVLEGSWLESVRAFERGEIEEMLGTAGFDVAEVLGEADDGAPAGAGEEPTRWMFLATRRPTIPR